MASLNDLVDSLANNNPLSEIGVLVVEELVNGINNGILRHRNVITCILDHCGDSNPIASYNLLIVLDIMVSQCGSQFQKKMANYMPAILMMAFSTSDIVKEKVFQVIRTWKTEIKEETARIAFMEACATLECSDILPSQLGIGEEANRCASCHQRFSDRRQLFKCICGQTVCVDCPRHFNGAVLTIGMAICKNYLDQEKAMFAGSDSDSDLLPQGNASLHTYRRSKDTSAVSESTDTGKPAAAIQREKSTESKNQNLTNTTCSESKRQATTKEKEKKHESKPQEFTRAELLQQMQQLNSSCNRDLFELANNGSFLDKMDKVDLAGKNDSAHFPQGNRITDWTKSNIRNWANNIRRDKVKECPDEEILAVAKRAYYLFRYKPIAFSSFLFREKIQLRDSQLLVILSFLSFSDEGLLLQIKTGEGKSTVCAILAVISVLKKQTVDIATSSSVLADRDVEEWSEFYDMFGITCASNEPKPNDPPYQEGPKKCYSKDIVYGSLHAFQADWLRHVHKKMKARGEPERKFGRIIIDEVDSIAIDEFGRVSRLASPIPGMVHLQPLLSAMFLECNRIFQQTLMVNGNWVYVHGEIETMEDGRKVAKPNATQYRLSSRNAFLRKHLKGHALSLIQNGVLRLPEVFKEYVIAEIDAYVLTCVIAVHMGHQRDYTISETRGDQPTDINPVDHSNTGIVQTNMKLSRGLHQFLQIKHRLRIDSESMCTSFISNLAYIRLYKGLVWGMTGTLGSEAEGDMLESVHNLRTGIMPSFIPSRLERNKGQVCGSQKEWKEAILSKIKCLVHSGRAVLVICETIADAQDIHDKAMYISTDVRLYCRSDNDDYLTVERPVDSGSIVIATNLAGRGTDIKVSPKVEQNGGLHVIVAFLPSNLRVEEQAFGRTARKGARGSAELIIHPVHFCGMHPLGNVGSSVPSIELVKRYRKIREYIQMQESRLFEAVRIEIRDSNFNAFLKLSDKLGGDQVMIRQFEDRVGLKLASNEKHLYIDTDAREQLEEKAKQFGFCLEFTDHEVKLDSLYQAISLQLGVSLCSESLQFVAVAAFVQSSGISSREIDKILQEMTDGKVLELLARVLGINIVVISSNKDNPDIFKVRDPKCDVHIGCENATTTHITQYRSLTKSMDSADQRLFEKETRIFEPLQLILRDLIIEETFAILENLSKHWVKKVEDSKVSQVLKLKMGANFKEFCDLLANEYSSEEKFLINPAHLTRLGVKKFDKDLANSLIEKALLVEPNYSIQASYKGTYLAVKDGKKQNIVPHLREAQRKIQDVLIQDAEFIQTTIISHKPTALSKQLLARIDVYKRLIDHMDEIIKVVEKSKRSVQIKETKRLKTLYYGHEDAQLMEKEADELIKDGLWFLFEAEETPINWWHVIFLAVVGIVQICVGTVLALCGEGTLSTKFLMEGAKDIYQCIMVAMGEMELDFEKYLSNKAVAALTVAISMGVNYALSEVSTAIGIEPASNKVMEILQRSLVNACSSAVTNAAVKGLFNMESEFEKLKCQLKQKINAKLQKELNGALDQLGKLAGLDRLSGLYKNIENVISIVKDLLNGKIDLFKEILNIGMALISKSTNNPVVKTILETGKHIYDGYRAGEQIDKLALEIASSIGEKVMNLPEVKEYFENSLGFILKDVGSIFSGAISSTDLTKMVDTFKILPAVISSQDMNSIVRLLEQSGALKGAIFDSQKALQVDFGQYNHVKTQVIDGLRKVSNLKRLQTNGIAEITKLLKSKGAFTNGIFNEMQAHCINFGQYENVKQEIIHAFKHASSQVRADDGKRIENELVNVCENFVSSLGINLVNETVGAAIEAVGEGTLSALGEQMANFTIFC